MTAEYNENTQGQKLGVYGKHQTRSFVMEQYELLRLNNHKKNPAIFHQFRADNTLLVLVYIPSFRQKDPHYEISVNRLKGKALSLNLTRLSFI